MRSISLLRTLPSSKKGEECVKQEVKITLPIVLGRGPLLKCGEKKISRQHAKLDWDDEGVVLTSAHSNPVFIEINGQLGVLSEGENLVLKHGDKFGLLKESFWFSLQLPEDIAELQNSAKSEDKQTEGDVMNNIEEEVKETKKGVKVKSMNSKEEITTNDDIINLKSKNTSKKTADEKLDDDDDKDKENSSAHLDTNVNIVKRKRSLPVWMMNTTPASKPAPAIVTHGASQKTKPGPKKRTPAKRKVDYLSDESGEESTVKVSKKINKRSPNKVSPAKSKKTTSPPKKLNHYMSSDESEDDDGISNIKSNANLKSSNIKTSQNVSPKKPAGSNSDYYRLSDSEADEPVQPKSRQSPSKKQSAQRNDLSDSDDENNSTTGASNVSQSRKLCRYGANCYRTNPDHKKAEAHPGDNDYKSGDEVDEDDDRPECEYGKKCFRKNPQHKRQYKHTSTPRPQRQAKKKAKQKRMNDDYDSEDSYDYSDPFLNDDSSDDYNPTDSETEEDDSQMDETEEDNTRRMLKEAKKFTSNK